MVQVVGHLKTCLILVLGFVVFNYPVIWKNVLGIFVRCCLLSILLSLYFPSTFPFLSLPFFLSVVVACVINSLGLKRVDRNRLVWSLLRVPGGHRGHGVVHGAEACGRFAVCSTCAAVRHGGCD